VVANWSQGIIGSDRARCTDLSSARWPWKEDFTDALTLIRALNPAT
jgi:hypothetical protein